MISGVRVPKRSQVVPQNLGGALPQHEPTWERDFPVIGQGVLTFNAVRTTPFCIVVRPKLQSGEKGADEFISLTVGQSSATFSLHQNGVTKELKTVQDHPYAAPGTDSYTQPVGFDPNKMISYWLSYNRDLLQIRYGRGYVMEETTCMEFDFLEGLTPQQKEDTRDKLKFLFSPTIRRRIKFYDVSTKQDLVVHFASELEKLTPIDYRKFVSDVGLGAVKIHEISSESKDHRKSKALELAKTLVDMEKKVELLSSPFVTNWSPLIKDSSSLHLSDLDSNVCILSASLPAACKELYSNVVSCPLDSPDDPYPLSDAIGYSINTKGCKLYQILEDKDEFGDPSQKYLRITLGPDRGVSAGIPYVLEIWPSKCGSPIHNHGNCFAVINVIHGAIDIEVFNKHAVDNDAIPIKKFTATKGQHTWISPNWFQTHKLYNSTSTYCATIQCYQYATSDTVEWPYFDYINDTNAIKEFLPNSDLDFSQMRDIVMKEYTASLHK